MSKLGMIPPAAAAISLLILGGCATKWDVQELRSDIAALRSSIEAGGRAPAAASANGPPPTGYEKVSTLTTLPDFIPGLGTLYVRPQTMPAGPFLAYDRNNRLVSTVYMIPLAEMQARMEFEHLAVGGETVHEVDFHYTPGHAGVDQPHYHVVLWHVPEETARLE
jgi:hypothetical protein